MRELRQALLLTRVTATAATLLRRAGRDAARLPARAIATFAGGRVLAAVLDLPLLIPHPVAGIALLLVLGRESRRRRGAPRGRASASSGRPSGSWCAMLFVSAPLYISGAREAFARVDPRYEAVARTLGDRRGASFRRVTLPLARRGLVAASVVMWARAVSEFGAIVILTYNPKVVSVLSYDRFTTLRPRRGAPGRSGAGDPGARSARRCCARCARASAATPDGRGVIEVRGLSRTAGRVRLRDVTFAVPARKLRRRDRPGGLGEDDAAGDDRRHRPAARRDAAARRRDASRTPAGGARGRHRLPARLSLSASVASTRTSRYGARDRRDRSTRRRAPLRRCGAARRDVRVAQRRRAPARRPRPRARAPARGPAPRRAVQRARSAPPRHDAARGARAPSRVGHSPSSR